MAFDRGLGLNFESCAKHGAWIHKPGLNSMLRAFIEQGHKNKPLVIHNLAEATAAVLTASKVFGGVRPWWRGQATVEWGLVPRAIREGKSEGNMYSTFRRLARTRHSDCPPDDNLADWLFLMQHYRLPTRLLDWMISLE